MHRMTWIRPIPLRVSAVRSGGKSCCENLPERGQVFNFKTSTAGDMHLTNKVYFPTSCHVHQETAVCFSYSYFIHAVHALWCHNRRPTS